MKITNEKAGTIMKSKFLHLTTMIAILSFCGTLVANQQSASASTTYHRTRSVNTTKSPYYTTSKSGYTYSFKGPTSNLR